MKAKGDRRGYDGTFGEVRSEMFAELVKVGACDLMIFSGRGEGKIVTVGLVRLRISAITRNSGERCVFEWFETVGICPTS